MIEDYDHSHEVQSVSSLVNDICTDKTINLNPIYQRNTIWPDDNNSRYINSTLKGIACNNITFNYDNKTGVKTCIDGKQRCTALVDFTKNKFPVEINDIYYYYGPLKNDIRNDIQNINDKNTIHILDEKLRHKFINRKVHIVTYNNLDFNQQTDIFNNIQHGKALTNGELILSKIENSSVCDLMKQYCDSKEEQLKLYYKKLRKENYSFIANMMYTLEFGISPLIKKNTDKFLNKLVKNNLQSYIIKIDIIINLLFTKYIFNSPQICKLKLSKSEVIIFCHRIYENELSKGKKLTNDDLKKIKNVIIKAHSYNINKSIKGNTKDILNKMASEFDEIYCDADDISNDDTDDSDHVDSEFIEDEDEEDEEDEENEAEKVEIISVSKQNKSNNKSNNKSSFIKIKAKNNI